jgi:hypothetical protein
LISLRLQTRLKKQGKDESKVFDRWVKRQEGWRENVIDIRRLGPGWLIDVGRRWRILGEFLNRALPDLRAGGARCRVQAAGLLSIRLSDMEG